MASGGLYRVAAKARLACLTLLLFGAVPARAASPAAISIGTTSLDAALNVLSRQGGVEIVSTERGLGTIRTRRVSGRMSVADALRRLLDGTGFQAVAIGPGAYRVVRGSVAVAVRRDEPGPGAPERVADIVVTASKQNVSLLRFPGSIIVRLPFTTNEIAVPLQDMDDFARSSPVLQTTEFGRGRNKVFIRGIADSSFNGATQATTNVYFGEVPLAYSGPGSGLSLHDIERVEIMEGPQGTLYGSGAIGGVIRITPNPVDLGSTHATMAAGAAATANGTPSFDVDGTINLPLVTERIGVRAVGYREHSGGYIDDLARHRRDTNGVDTIGGRVAFRAKPAEGWDVDIGFVGQRIAGDDAQYSISLLQPLQRSSAIAQPYVSSIVLARAVVTKDWDSGLRLVSATGLALRHLDDVFDATPMTGPMPGAPNDAQYQDIRNGRLFTQELRLSHSFATGSSWLIGATLIDNRDVQTRTLGPIASPIEITGVANFTTSISGFGEGTLAFTPRFSATFGIRATSARIDGEPSAVRSNEFVRGRSTLHVDPTVAFSWMFANRAAVFARFQSGYRTGGLAVARGVGRVADYDPDEIRMGEFGLRMIRRGDRGVSLSSAVSYARWKDIQADLIDRRGQPFTLNIGNASILAVESSVDWVPFKGLKIAGSALFTSNRLDGVAASTSALANRRLPKTPPFSGNASVNYRWRAFGDGEARIGGTVSYFGRTVLGPGVLFDISQDNYAVADVSAGWRRKRLDLSLSIENVANTHANRFAFGNIFNFSRRDEITPLRPFTIRLGAGIAW